jgi:hypothetical protein
MGEKAFLDWFKEQTDEDMPDELLQALRSGL